MPQSAPPNPAPVSKLAVHFVLGLALAGFGGTEPSRAASIVYQPTAESLATHKVPEWFEDAKFGMFIDWGLFSIPGWASEGKPDGATYPDWYLYDMYQGVGVRMTTQLYHWKVWGKDFTRDDFIPLFKASAYDPELLASVAKASGCKYVVPLAKHHDGFCLWPSSQTDRNSVKMGPKRDLIRPLVDACRANGLKFGFYYSLSEWEYPLIGQDGKLVVRVHRRDYETGKTTLSIEPYDERAFHGKFSGKHPVRDFARDYVVPQSLEFIKLYDPDLIWFDGSLTNTPQEFHSYEIVADYYNQAAGRKEVAVNDREGIPPSLTHGDFSDSEHGAFDGNFVPRGSTEAVPKKWEELQGMTQSFGYNQLDTEANALTPAELVQLLVTTVARNGNLLLVVNLDGQGALPELQWQRLQEIGRWLSLNGEAIYATRPWDRTHDGDGIWFTRSKDRSTLYAICFDWPAHGVTLHGITAASGSEIRMLGVAQALRWTQDRQDLKIEVPAGMEQAKPCQYAYVVKVRLPSS